MLCLQGVSQGLPVDDTNMTVNQQSVVSGSLEVPSIALSNVKTAEPVSTNAINEYMACNWSSYRYR